MEQLQFLCGTQRSTRPMRSYVTRRITEKVGKIALLKGRAIHGGKDSEQ